MACLVCDENKVSVAETSPNTWQVTVNNIPINGYTERSLAIAAAQALVDCDPDSKYLDFDLLEPWQPNHFQQYLIDCLKSAYTAKYGGSFPIEDSDALQIIEMSLISQNGEPWPRRPQAEIETLWLEAVRDMIADR